jgi:hypothetical protein
LQEFSEFETLKDAIAHVLDELLGDPAWWI